MNKFEIEVWNTKIPNSTIEYIQKAFDSRSLSTGKYTKEFEVELSNIHNENFCVCVNSGTSALKCIAMALELKPDDEIIIPRRSWIATVNAFHELGLKIILADVDSSRGLLCPNSLKSLVSDKTKAVVTVNLNGRNSISNEILSIISSPLPFEKLPE